MSLLQLGSMPVSYISSFYIYDVKGKKLNSLLILDGLLYVLIDNQLIVYKLGKSITNNYVKIATKNR